MKRLTFLAMLFTLMIISGVPVLADEYTEKGNAFMTDFIKAINTGNYSLIEQHMGDKLKDELGREEFSQLRDFTVANYGKLLSFRFITESRDDGMVKLEYEVTAEKGRFPVALAYKNGKLIGIGLGIRAKANPAGMIAMILGALMALGAFYTVKKPVIPDLVLGTMVALGLSVIIPFYGIISLILTYSSLERALFMGTATAITVEAVKFYLSKNRDGLSIGLGLGIGQYILLTIGTFVATNFIMKLPVSFTGATYWAFLVALTFTIFHAFSSHTYSFTRRIGYLSVFTALETGILTLEAMNMIAMGLLLTLIAIVIGFYGGGGGLNGVTGQKTN
ncbi:DUF3887 domain-containing protein [Thermococcus sp.]